ncbi:MAG TPA: ABC transporter permease [Chitinophagaceae bacterium]|nr:ABC transporter permease [Chitinophagaceae bacterium]
MQKPYSPLSAAFAIGKASFLAMIRSPTAVVFSILFPVIFIIVFGSMVDTTALDFKLAVSPGCDTANAIFTGIEKIEGVTLVRNEDTVQQAEDLDKARLTAILNIQRDSAHNNVPHYSVTLTSANAESRRMPILKILVDEVVSAVNKQAFPGNSSMADVQRKDIPGRVYRQIDFILPGQLGFSLLMAGVFGSAFLLFGLRKSLVFKRISATPVNRFYVILGEMLSRFIFQVTGFSIMIALGYFAFKFTLVNGWLTFFEMLVFSIEGLVVFMGIGFIISGLVQNEGSIAPVANTFTLPQILLCGLFFPIENYPAWLQWFCNKLPLTFFTDGMRKIAFEGVHIWQMPRQLTGLTIWALVISFIAAKTFKWV